MFIDGEMEIGIVGVEGKPFEGNYELFIENKKLGKDLLNEQQVIKIRRDNKGRIRKDYRTKKFRIVEIQDPVSSIMYLLNVENKTAISRARIAMSLGVANSLKLINIITELKRDPIRSPYLELYEILPPQVFNSLVCEGIRLDLEYVDNEDNLVKRFEEIWYCDKLQEIVTGLFSYGTHNEIHKLLDIELADQNIDFFIVPKDYELFPNGTLLLG
jgi:hypothetical protein